jgi:hypothetical protein
MDTSGETCPEVIDHGERDELLGIILVGKQTLGQNLLS